LGQEQCARIIGAIEELRRAAGKPEKVLPPAKADNPAYDAIKSRYYDAFRAAKTTAGKMDRRDAIGELRDKIVPDLLPEDVDNPKYTPAQLSAAIETLEERVARDAILAGQRIDGRTHKQLRPITCKVSYLPRVHGSALFQRGETQALVTTTL